MTKVIPFILRLFSASKSGLFWLFRDKVRVLIACILLLLLNHFILKGKKTKLEKAVKESQLEIQLYKKQIPELQKIIKIQRDSLLIQKKRVHLLDKKLLEDELLIAHKDSLLDMKDGQIREIQVTLKKVLEREKSKDRQLSTTKVALSKCLNFKPPNTKSNAD